MITLTPANLAMTMHISIITTGGTIDGADSEKQTSRSHSDAVKWLKNQPGIDVKHISLMNKDSRLIDENDRANIVRTVLQQNSSLIIVTHGTFTICETGRAVKEALHSSAKTILLVGAWIPFNNPGSDAEHQMAFALNILRSPRQGVFIAMDNYLWDPNFTEKRETTPGQYQLEITTP